MGQQVSAPNGRIGSGGGIQKPVPLLEFPTELLLEIMSYLPGSSLQLLRSTCSLFFYLSQRSQFSHSQGPRSRISPLFIATEITKPPVVDISKLNKGEREEMRELLQSDLYCNSCYHQRQNITKWTWRTSNLLLTSLYCSGCKITHTRILFSQKQRKATDQERICIGREGSIRLCENVSLTWNNLEDMKHKCRPSNLVVASKGIKLERFTVSESFHCGESETGHDHKVEFTLNNKQSLFSSHRLEISTGNMLVSKLGGASKFENEAKKRIQHAMPTLRNMLCGHIACGRYGVLPVWPSQENFTALSGGLARAETHCPVCQSFGSLSISVPLVP